jgi:hypothetical protein
VDETGSGSCSMVNSDISGREHLCHITTVLVKLLLRGCIQKFPE